MRRLLPILLAVSMASCAHLHLAAERKQFAARHAEACKRLDREPSSLLERTIARPDQFPFSSWEQAYPDTPRGTLTKADVAEVAYANENDVRDCYEDALRSWPDASGRVAVRFAINPSGEVEGMAIESNATGIHPLACCIAEAVRSWRFPQPVGGGPVIVHYPFVLEPLL